MMAGLENPVLLAVSALAIPGIYFAVKREERYRKTVSLLSSTLIVVLAVAAASPYVTVDQSTMEEPRITVLKDLSTSTEVMENRDIEFEEVDTNQKVIASGNSSDLQDGFIRNLEPNSAYLAVTDLRSSSSLDGIAKKFREKNSTISFLKPETGEEVSVSIEGPASTVPGATNSFRVKTYSTRTHKAPEVYLDGEKVETEKIDNSTWKLERSFEEKGRHTLEARINRQDRFRQNNRYFHTVKVNEKPEVLVLGEKQGLEETLGEFYELEYRQNLPEDLSDYYTIIMKKDPSREPIEYVSKGNGVVYTGNYEQETDLLPVKKSPESDRDRGAKIVMAIDISRGTEEGASKKIKTIAYNLIDKIPVNNRMGAVAYNRDATLISRPKPLATSRKELQTKISRLDPSGPSFHDNGIRGAKKLLNGTGNIILVTDGRIGGLGSNENVGSRSRQIASGLEVRLITVGAGDNRQEDYLKDLAGRGNGFYIDSEQSGRLKFRFEAGGASGESVPLVNVNPDHYITENLELDSAASYFDSVEERRGANLLVSGTDGRPFLTTWRYGLGRVAAFSGGDQQLSDVSRLDPLLLTRTVAWSAGEPLRKNDKWMKIRPARKPENTVVEASYQSDGLVRQGENLYRKEIEPPAAGFHSFQDRTYAYNYNEEIEEIGYSEKMEEVARKTGGEVYKRSEKEEIVEDLQKFSEKKVETKRSLTTPLLVVALILFLAQVGYRKMNGKK